MSSSRRIFGKQMVLEIVTYWINYMCVMLLKVWLASQKKSARLAVEAAATVKWDNEMGQPNSAHRPINPTATGPAPSYPESARGTTFTGRSARAQATNILTYTSQLEILASKLMQHVTMVHLLQDTALHSTSNQSLFISVQTSASLWIWMQQKLHRKGRDFWGYHVY